MTQEVNLVIGLKSSEGTLKLDIIEVNPDETTLSEAAERVQNPDFDYITVVKAVSTATPEAEPKEHAA
jgi:hypothetical protein